MVRPNIPASTTVAPQQPSKKRVASPKKPAPVDAADQQQQKPRGGGGFRNKPVKPLTPKRRSTRHFRKLYVMKVAQIHSGTNLVTTPNLQRLIDEVNEEQGRTGRPPLVSDGAFEQLREFKHANLHDICARIAYVMQGTGPNNQKTIVTPVLVSRALLIQRLVKASAGDGQSLDDLIRAAIRKHHRLSKRKAAAAQDAQN